MPTFTITEELLLALGYANKPYAEANCNCEEPICCEHICPWANTLPCPYFCCCGDDPESGCWHPN